MRMSDFLFSGSIKFGVRAYIHHMCTYVLAQQVSEGVISASERGLASAWPGRGTFIISNVFAYTWSTRRAAWSEMVPNTYMSLLMN